MKRKLFEQIYDKWMAMSQEEIIVKWNDENGDDFLAEYEDEVEESLLYYRQDYCYHEIWQKFEHTLYDDDDIVYLSLFGPYDRTVIMNFVKMCHEKYVEWLEEFEKEFEEKTK